MMYLVLPYRAKNPPERFPYVTVSLIAVNVLIFALTSEFFLSIQEGVAKDWAVSLESLSFVRLMSAQFLHADLFHLLSNMLFLWVLGSAVEGRLRPLKFLAVYLLAGLTGNLLHVLVAGALNPEAMLVGASGAIFGLAGAYLYMFPFATICVFWFFWILFRIRGGLAEWQAQWVILLFAGLDLLQGLLFMGMDGVAHLAHLGGFGLGLLTVMLLRVKRDSEEFSEAQKMRVNMQGDYTILASHELEALMENPAENVPLIMAYCKKMLVQSGGPDCDRCAAALKTHGNLLLQKADPDQLARLLLLIPYSQSVLPLVFYLRLGSRLESNGTYDLATLLYRRVYEINPGAPDSETALYRAARLTEQTNPDAKQAAPFYTEMLRRFPKGSLADQARAALQRLGVAAPPAIVFSPGSAAPPTVPQPMPVPAPPLTGTPAAETPPVLDDDLRPVGGMGSAAASTPATSSANTPLAQTHYNAPEDDDLMPIGGYK